MDGGLRSNLLTDWTALTKVFADDESYNSGHGRLYERLGVDPAKGAIIVVRPDHCELPPECVYP